MSDRLSPTPDEALRRVHRLADRLRVMGPRLAGRSGDDAARTLAEVRAGLQRLADLTAAEDGEPVRPVPVLGGHALADQVLVLGHDLLTGRSDRFRRVAMVAVDDVYDLL